MEESVATSVVHHKPAEEPQLEYFSTSKIEEANQQLSDQVEILQKVADENSVKLRLAESLSKKLHEEFE